MDRRDRSLATEIDAKLRPFAFEPLETDALKFRKLMNLTRNSLKEVIDRNQVQLFEGRKIWIEESGSFPRESARYREKRWLPDVNKATLI